MLSLFQTATGGLHWPSVLALFGWLASTAVIFSGLALSSAERFRAGPWRFSDVQLKELRSTLEGMSKGKVAIEYTAADQVRSHEFATTLRQVFTEAGFEVWGYMPAFHQTGNAAPVRGVEIGAKEVAVSLAKDIKRAFDAIGLDSKIIKVTNNNYSNDYVVIFVGIKP